MRHVSSISLALVTLMVLAMGCASPAPPPVATSAPYLAFQLDVKIDPKEAATFLLNPTPLGKGGYPQGMVITIDILPKQGWQIDKWVGPVFNIDGTTAQIEMVSSQSVAVRLKNTTPPTLTPTDTPTPTPLVSSISGTSWFIRYAGVTDLSNESVEFLPNGRLKSLNGSPTDRWEQDGAVVRLYWNNNYATYIGTRSGDFMAGKASNVAGDSWNWNATPLR